MKTLSENIHVLYSQLAACAGAQAQGDKKKLKIDRMKTLMKEGGISLVIRSMVVGMASRAKP